MHGQGNYPKPVGQGSYAPPSVFQQRPAGATTPPTFHHGPLAAQPQFMQQGRPPFHLTPGMPAYHHSQPNAANQGPQAPLVSSGMSSAQSYLNNPQAQAVHLSTQISRSYPTSERQTQPWNQNVHQLPPPPPLMAPNAHSVPSTQVPTIERGPPHQLPSYAPPPPMPPNSSGSSFSTSDPSGTSSLSVRPHSYLHAMGPPPPPPALPLPLPPPPPPPFSSPPGAPPLPPADILSKYDGSRSLKENLLHKANATLDCPPPVKPVEDRSVDQIEVSRQYTGKYGPKVESVDAVVAHSPADSDMDMEG